MATMHEQLNTLPVRMASEAIRLTTTAPKKLEIWTIPGRIVGSVRSVLENYHAAREARARAKFAAKMGLVLEDPDEGSFWLELLTAAGLSALLLIASTTKQASKVVSVVSVVRREYPR
jgi:four helix bundle protein